MAAALWDMVGKAANVLQLIGLDAFTLLAMAVSFLRFHLGHDRECRKLSDRARMLGVLMLSPAGCLIMTTQQQQGDEVTKALDDAHVLINSYKQSTLFWRVVQGKAMARQMRDLHFSIDSYCRLILTVNAFLLIIVQPNPPPPPSPSPIRNEVNNGDVAPSIGYSTATDREEASTATVLEDIHIIDVHQE